MDPKPFNSPDADVVLRATDGTSFRIFSRIIAEASPFFRDLLTLPQPVIDKDGSNAIIDVSERSETIHVLLTFVYPIEDPPVETLSLLSEVLGAALKYEFGLAVQSLRRLLISPNFVQKAPTRVYAIACRYHLEEEAKIASAHTLTVQVLDAPPAEELKYITAFDYHKLLDLHRTRGMAAKLLVENTQAARCSHCSCPPRWWANWSTRAQKELGDRPTTDIIFSLPFLAESSMAGCMRCGTSLLESHVLMAGLKSHIDELRATV